MVPIRRDPDALRADSVRPSRRVDARPGVDDEATREAGRDRRVPSVPRARGTRPCGPTRHRARLRGSGRPGAERRLGDPPEGAAGDEGIADAARVEADAVRTAHMFLGDLGLVAEIALLEGAEGLRSRGLRLLAPMKPMLAEMADDLDEVLAEHGGQTAIEFKLDGARIQIHRLEDRVKIFSPRLSDVTGSLPEIAAIARSLPARAFLLEGEGVATDRDGKPLPFQDLMRR